MSEALLATAVGPDELGGEVVATLEGEGRLATLFLDHPGDRRRLVAAIAGPGELSVITAELEPGSDRYASLTPRTPAADWYEREIRDLYGVVPDGHPDLDPLVLPRDARTPAPSPGLRRAVAPVVPSEEPLARLVRGEGIFTIPYGPVRSGVLEAIEYVVETPGEDIPRLRVRPHYKHRGVEAAFVGRSLEDGALLAERVEGVASVAHAIAYCEALERLAGTTVPAPAQLVRVVHAELERVAAHLDSTARHAEAAGQAVALARLGFHRERLMRLRGALSGSRFGRGVVVPGGVRGPLGLAPDELRAALDPLERDVRADLRSLAATPSFLDRLRGTGTIPAATMRLHGGLGPLARGSASAEDVRATRPYGAYRDLAFLPALHDEGDALARQRVRNEEVDGAFGLARQALEGLAGLERPDGARWAVPLGAVSGAAFGWAEAPQGEVLTYVRVEDGRLARVKPRSASFHNLALFTAAFPRDITTDFAFIEASFGVSGAGAAL